jgi:hypothetical protein
MTKGVVSASFKGLARVNFSVDNPRFSAALIDTVAYTVNGKPGITWVG